MEKFLLTCFLALLCLYGSATIAQVADSPTAGADLVDKVSGPHRGGEIRPDTSSSEEFGLFDKYLDPGAGGETSGSLPAPVTVSAHQIRKDHTTPKSGKHRASDTGHPTPLPSPVYACPPWRGLPSQYIGHPTPSIRHRSSFSLVDQYLDPGAGEETSGTLPAPVTVSTQVLKRTETVREVSDRESLGSCVLHLDSYSSLVDTDDSVGKGSLGSPADGGAIVLYIQGEGRILPNEVRAMFLPGVIDQGARAPEFWEDKADFTQGMLWTGTYGAKWARLVIPADQSGALSVYLDEVPVIDGFLSFPSDSVKLFVNLARGTRTFAGPDFRSFELQDRISNLQARLEKERGSVVHYRSGERLFAKEELRQAYEESQASFGAIMKLNRIDVPRMLAEWEAQMRTDTFEQELKQLLSTYASKLDAGVLEFIGRERLAAYQTPKVNKLNALIRYSKETPAHHVLILEALNRFKSSLSAGVETVAFPPGEKEIALWHKILQVQSQLEARSLQSLIASVPAAYQDRIRAKQIYQDLERGTASPAEMTSMADQITDSSIREQVQGYVQHTLPGSAIADFRFRDQDGTEYSLDDFRGKVVLLNTYFTGCSASASYYKDVLSGLEYLKEEEDLVLISLTADRDSLKWQQGNESGRYNSSQWLRLSTDGQGYSHPFFRNFLISVAPRPMLIDRQGKLVAVTELYQYHDRLRELISKTLNSPTL